MSLFGKWRFYSDKECHNYSIFLMSIASYQRCFLLWKIRTYQSPHSPPALCCDCHAPEGLPGTSSLCRMVDGFPEMIYLLLSLALQLVLCTQPGPVWLFFHPGWANFVGASWKIMWSVCSEMLHTSNGAL